MYPRLFHRLRRCRVLFALALCAWLAMGSLAWAGTGCCAGMAVHGSSMQSMSMPGMAAMHAVGHAQHPPAHHAGHGECTCAHAPADLSVMSMPVDSIMPGQLGWRLLALAAPQPSHGPPLRPPAA